MASKCISSRMCGGISVSSALIPAFPHDNQGLLHLLDELIELGMHHLTLIIIRDRAYFDQAYTRMLKETYAIEIYALQYQYDKERPKIGLNELLRKTRKIIETTHSALTQTLNAKWTAQFKNCSRTRQQISSL